MSITPIKLITDGNVEVKTIRVRRDDLIVLKTKNILKQYSIEHFVKSATEILGFKICVVHIQLEEDIDVISKEQMNILGWYRKEQLQEKLAPEF